jgi:hypothetical protein
VIFRFIAANKADHSIKTMCRVLGVSRSGFHAWENRAPSPRGRENERLLERIRAIHEENRKVYPGRWEMPVRPRRPAPPLALQAVSHGPGRTRTFV